MNLKPSNTSLQPSLTSHKPTQSYAPFGSVSPRTKRKKKFLPIEQLGPGSYDIAFPIIKPLIQTIKKKNNNIIVKLAHLGTSSFQGQQQRFSCDHPSHQSTQGVGPGKYSPQKSMAYLQNSRVESRSFELPKRKSAGSELARFIKNKERRAATFSEVKKIELEEYVEMPAGDGGVRGRGRGSNNEQSANSKVKGSLWSRMKEDRLKDVKNPYQNIGPGQYYIDDFAKKPQHPKHRSISDESPAFRSQSIRSFFDGIKFETNQEKKALMREVIGYKSQSLGPGAYEVGVSKAKENRFQFFGSTVERG